MRRWNNAGKRGLALFLALLMCVNLLSLAAFAAEERAEEPVGEEIVDALNEQEGETRKLFLRSRRTAT